VRQVCRRKPADDAAAERAHSCADREALTHVDCAVGCNREHGSRQCTHQAAGEKTC
jgi:hypothetical protein